MYHAPDAPPVDGSAFDFLELKNSGSSPLDLSGLTFTDGIIFTFPHGAVLEPASFAVLVSDLARFQTRYPGAAVEGVYAGALDNSGETLTLNHPLAGRVFSVTYNDRAPWPAAADGHGFSMVQVNVSLSQAPDQGRKWRASSALWGSPGADDPDPVIPTVVLNEILAHTDPPQADSVELYNPTESDADLSGWFLTDDPSLPQKFRFPNSTILPAGAYLVLNESQFNHEPKTASSFALSSVGDSLYLFSADPDGALTGYSHGLSFGASFNGVSFGRVVNSNDQESFPLASTLTLGRLNAEPYASPLIITEIHYHPLINQAEFIELYNRSDEAVHLYDTAALTNTWRLNGLDFAFPENLTVEPSAFLILSAVEPDVFRAAQPVPSETIVLGPCEGQLQNDGERLELLVPDVPNTNEVPYVAIETVDYNDQTPWPPAADGTGLSLQRLNTAGSGNDPNRWIAAEPTPGSLVNVTGDTDGDGLPDEWEILYGTDWRVPDADVDLDQDGFTNGEEYTAGTHPRDPSSALRILTQNLQDGALRIQFMTAAHRSYSLLWAPTLNTAWSRLADQSPSAEDTLATLVIDNPPDAPGFYRLATPAQP